MNKQLDPSHHRLFEAVLSLQTAEECRRFFEDICTIKELNALALRKAGVTKIEISEECTMCLPDRYWSQRANGYQRGNQGAIILCKEDSK